MISVIRQLHDAMQAACVWFGDRVYLGWFAVEQGLRQVYVYAPLLFSILFAAVIKVAYTCFREDKDITNALVHLRKNEGAGEGRGKQPPKSQRW